MAGILTLIITVIVLTVLDIYVFPPVLFAIAGWWAIPLMLLILLIEGVGVFGEIAALA